jgi:D-alanyl-D-alanine carboxypeptidase/D-alanyl-D-alanine-endopeptidase (penicillin-binding protein 4)
MFSLRAVAAGGAALLLASAAAWARGDGAWPAAPDAGGPGRPRLLLPEPVREAMRRADLPEDAVGIVVLPQDGRGPTLVHRGGVPMQPASTIKLITTAVALDRLGANHSGHTQLLTTAPVQADVLQGELILRGGADPDLDLPQLWALLAELRWNGIREIAGDVVLDRTLFRPARSDLGLPPFDDAPEFPYNVIPDALQLAGNLVTLELAADEQRIHARLLPPLERVELVNGLEPVEATCERWDEGKRWRTPATTRVGETVRIELRGGFPLRCRQRLALQLMDRNDLAERLIAYAWANLGGVWRGRVREGAAPDAARLLAERRSRPWGEVLRTVNKRSDNPLTRMLFLSLGIASMAGNPAASTGELAALEVKRWLAERGIAPDGLVIENGSGLSRLERITPMQLARAIQAALGGPHAPEILMSLPLAGVDGSFRQRFRDSAANGRAWLKPGGLRNVGALAGLVLDDRGKGWVVVAIVNHEPPRSRGPIDALVDWVARGSMRGATSQGCESSLDSCIGARRVPPRRRRRPPAQRERQVTDREAGSYKLHPRHLSSHPSDARSTSAGASRTTSATGRDDPRAFFPPFALTGAAAGVTRVRRGEPAAARRAAAMPAEAAGAPGARGGGRRRLRQPVAARWRARGHGRCGALFEPADRRAGPLRPAGGPAGAAAVRAADRATRRQHRRFRRRGGLAAAAPARAVISSPRSTGSGSFRHRRRSPPAAPPAASACGGYARSWRRRKPARSAV